MSDRSCPPAEALPRTRPGLPCQRDRLLQQGLEHLHIDVVQALRVEAAFGGLALAQLRHQLGLLLEDAGRAVDHQLRRARAEGRQRRIALVAAGVGVVVVAVADDRRTIHVRLRAGELVHQFHQRAGIVAHFFLGLLVDEGIHAGGGGLGLVGFRHECKLILACAHETAVWSRGRNRRILPEL